MTGESNLRLLLQNMQPKLHPDEYVFTSQESIENIVQKDIVGMFREEEGITLIMKKSTADDLNLAYGFIAAMITLSVHSSLEAIGLTAAISTILAEHNISCNIVAAFYHDHIFVNKKDGKKALEVLTQLAQTE